MLQLQATPQSLDLDSTRDFDPLKPVIVMRMVQEESFVSVKIDILNENQDDKLSVVTQHYTVYCDNRGRATTSFLNNGSLIFRQL